MGPTTRRANGRWRIGAAAVLAGAAAFVVAPASAAEMVQAPRAPDVTTPKAATPQIETPKGGMVRIANASLRDASGKAVGDADLTQTANGVLIKLRLKGIKPGEHAFHIHAVGRCEPPFTSAGPHFNPGKHQHGMMAGPGHAGDMPNLRVPQSGDLDVEIVNSAVSLQSGAANGLIGGDGTALVVHAGADDYKSDPAGNAGDRIACGVVTESGAPKP